MWKVVESLEGERRGGGKVRTDEGGGACGGRVETFE